MWLKLCLWDVVKLRDSGRKKPQAERVTQVEEVMVLNCSCADVGLPAASEPLMGVKEVRDMVQLILCILEEPYSK